MQANEKWPEGVWDIEVFKKGRVSLIFFAPQGVDHQTSHDEDEFYFIASGSAKISIEDEIFPCESGDAFFVHAGCEHRFSDQTSDFSTWAVFF